MRHIILQSLLWTFLNCHPTYAATHQPNAFLHQIQGSPHEGAKIVEHFCAVCHAAHPDIVIGAPRMHFFKDWLPRLKQGMPSLFKHTDEGINAMPPRGGCFECSDAQLLLAIESLIGKNSQDYLVSIKKSH